MEISWDFFKEHGDLLNEFLLDSGSPLLLVSAQKVISVVQVADMTNTAVFISLFMWDTYSSDDFLITRQDSPPPPPPHHHPFFGGKWAEVLLVTGRIKLEFGRTHKGFTRSCTPACASSSSYATHQLEIM